MKQVINITKSIGQYIDFSFGQGLLPCTDYTTKEQGSYPLYQAMLQAARDIIPFALPLYGDIKGGEYSIRELAKVKAPVCVLRNALPDNMKHLRFLIGGSKYEAGAEALFNALNSVRTIVRAGDKDKLCWRPKMEEERSNAEKPTQPSFAELLRNALRISVSG